VYGSAPIYTPAVTPYSTAAAGSNAASAYVFKTLLTVGSSGKDVTALQQLLVKLGFLTVTPTGYFGALTKAALQKYQSAHAISPVGYAGPATRGSLSTGK
jgi:peptidoglycan hydrolase-like protein with peptidoglycan-binding domain